MADTNYLETIDIPDGNSSKTLTVKDSGAARTDHVHGNITNGGAITASGVTIAADDALAIVDSSDSSKIAKTSITFDGSTTTQALTKKGSFESFLQSHQTIKQDGVTGATVNRFGTCSIAAATAAKTVSITTGTFTLEAGARVTVKFSNANTASSPTLNVNSTGAKNIFHKGSQITTGTNKALLAGTVDFIYDGTQWHLIGNYLDTDTKVNVTLGTTTKAYLLGTSTAPTSSAQAVTSIADTDVYLDSTAGKLHAKTLDATTYSGLPTATTSASGIVSLTDSVSTTSSTVAATATAVKTVNTLATTNQTNILSVDEMNGARNEYGYNYGVASLMPSGLTTVITPDGVKVTGTISSNLTAFIVSYSTNNPYGLNAITEDYVVKLFGSCNISILVQWIDSENTRHYDGLSSPRTIPSGSKIEGIYIQKQTTSSFSVNVDVQLLICKKRYYDAGFTTYQPYSLPNTAITPELIELVDSGAKNLLDFANMEHYSNNQATYTTASNSITVTSTGSWGFAAFKTPALANGTYVLSCTVSNMTTASNIVAMGTQLSPDNIVKYSGNNRLYITFTLPATKTQYIYLYANFSANSTTNSVTFSDLMICTAAAWNVSHKYVPYRPNWDLVVSSKINHTSAIGEADLNTVTTDGTYTVQPTANSPVSSLCFLEVYNTGSYDVKQVLQRLDDAGNLYIRHRKYTSTSPYYSWSSWYKFTGTIVN